MPGPIKSNDRALDVRQEWLDKLSPEEAEVMRQTLRANSGKNFVQRITNASDWPTVANPDGSYSSHRMASAEGGGQGYAFPTLFYDKGPNALDQPQDPMSEARKTGEFIEFPDPAAAERFAEGGYKVGMDTGLMQKMLRPEVVNKMWR